MIGDIIEPHGTARTSNPPLNFLALLRKSFAAHAIFLFLAGGFALLFACVAVIVEGVSEKVSAEAAAVVPTVIIPMSAIMLVAVVFIRMGMLERPERPTLSLIRHLVALGRDPTRWAAVIPIYLSLCIFMFSFGHWKSSITVFQPFAWDETFDRLDVMLHFGRRPWEWLQPVFGYPLMTRLLGINYNIWFLILVSFWIYYGFLVRPCVERTRFFLTFMLTWMIGGSLCAILFSSAGPCYFGAGKLAIEPDPYAGLMDYLHTASETLPVWALSVQEMLWQSLGDTMPFGGVSAMPSMHNASALLFLLTSRRFPRPVRLFLAAHLVLIFIGSVHLAWHYAVDSYLAWAITLAVWYPAGALARWWEGRPPAKAFSRAIGAQG